MEGGQTKQQLSVPGPWGGWDLPGLAATLALLGVRTRLLLVLALICFDTHGGRLWGEDALYTVVAIVTGKGDGPESELALAELEVLVLPQADLVTVASELLGVQAREHTARQAAGGAGGSKELWQEA